MRMNPIDSISNDDNSDDADHNNDVDDNEILRS